MSEKEPCYWDGGNFVGSAKEYEQYVEAYDLQKSRESAVVSMAQMLHMQPGEIIVEFKDDSAEISQIAGYEGPPLQ